jgi:nucleotide-binding universal stress UspA family protein
MSIVCATDFSEWGRAAEDAAAAIAGRLGEPLWLLHVQEPDVEVLDAASADKVRSFLEERLVQTASRLAPQARGVVQTALKSGRVVPAVRQFAAHHKARLVVVGSAGHGASGLLRLGGTSEQIASGTDVPVLVVREGDSFVEWAKGRPLKVLLGLDEDASSASALRWVSTLRAVAPVDVVVGRVYYAGEAHEHYGFTGRRFSFTDPDPVLESLIERDLKRLVPSLPGTGEVFYRAKLGVTRVAEHLLELGEAERCQLVVVGSHRRTGLSRMWSVSAATLHLSRMSVAIVPPGEGDDEAHMPQPRFKRVLVTTDFSRTGNSAVPWAYAMVDAGGEVLLVHVTPTEGVAAELADLYSPALPTPHAAPKVEAELAARLRTLTPVSASARDVVTRTHVLRSSEPARAINALAQQLGVDTIVIASHGRSGVSRAVLGSVAEAVLRDSTRPVFVVRTPVQ